jgi:hypothetical protein
MVTKTAAFYGVTTFKELKDILGRKISCPYLTQAYIDYPLDTQWEFSVIYEADPAMDFHEARHALTQLEIKEILERGTLAPNGLNSNLGYNLSASTKEKIRESQTGKMKSELQRARMSQSQNERWAVRRAAALKNALNKPI